MGWARLGGLLAGHRLRPSWRAHLGVALLIAFTVGLSLFSLAGARRTQSSFPSFLRDVEAATVSVTSFGDFDPAVNASIAALPAVERSRTYVGAQTFVLRDGRPDLAQSYEASASFDGRYFDQDRFTATAGRRPDPERSDEIAVNEPAADAYGYRVGQRLVLGTYPLDQTADPAFGTVPMPPAHRVTVTIVGIGVFPDEVLQHEADHLPRMLLTPAFTREVEELVTYGVQGLRLRGGNAAVDEVKERLASRFPPGAIEVRVTSRDAEHSLRATRPLAIALAAFGVLVGVAALVLGAQGLASLVRRGRDEQAALRAIGVSPRMLLLSSLAGPAATVVVGVGWGVGMAILASPLMPIGPVRRVAGPQGFDADGTVLVLGGIAAVVVLTALSAAVAWRQLPHRPASVPSPARRATITRAVQAAGLDASAALGVRAALDRQPATPVSGRPVLTGMTVAIAALVGALTFGHSLETLVERPALYGWDWDAALLAGNGYDKLDPLALRSALDAAPEVDEWSGAYFGVDHIDGLETPLLGMALGSRVTPPLLSGRMMASGDEVVLGAATADRLGRGIGDRVTLAGETEPHSVRVVGVATLPTIGVVHGSHTSLGIGALVVPELVPGFDRDITGVRRDGLGPSAVFVRFAPGSEREDDLARLRATTAPLAGFAGLDVLDVQRPAEIASTDAAGRAPVALAGALAVAAAASLAVALRGSVARRRRELTVLAALGLTPRDLSRTVSWQALTTVAVGLLIGIPSGVVVGRVLWRRFAEQLHVVARPTVPTHWLVAVGVATAVVALGAAALPKRSARKIDPALLLRAD